MTHTADYSLSGVPGARRGVGSDVVEVRCALPPAALHALSLSSTYVSLKTAPDGGGGRAGGREWGGGGRATVGWGGGSERDERQVLCSRRRIASLSPVL